MALVNKEKRKTLKIVLGSIIVLALIILSYFQFIYQAKRVEGHFFQLERTFTRHQHIVNAIQFSPDGNLVASASVDSTVKVWNRATGEILYQLQHPCGLTDMDYSRDGHYISTTGYDQKVRLWKLPEAKLIREFSGHSRTPWSVAISPDNKLLATGGEDATINIWNAETGAHVTTLTGHTLTVWSLQFTPDGKQLVSGSYDNTLKFWSIPAGSLIRSIEAHTEAIVAIAISHDGETVASASDDKIIKLWSVQDGSLLKTLDESEEHVQAIAFSPDDRWLISGGRDKPMIGELLQEFFGDSKMNRGVIMRLWDWQKGTILQTFDHHGNDATDMAFSPDGQRIALSSADHTVSVWKRNK
jgi:WD40 repeat protein